MKFANIEIVGRNVVERAFPIMHDVISNVAPSPCACSYPIPHDHN